ncbi:MAG TPA: helix-turn-helix domain-containing protein [Actinoplanes sp.]|jgi:AcrR family transcriptional regulator
MAQRLRADAERNRAALLAAAREVFGEHGLDASLDEVARRAGVGNATLYRRFPSRGDLISEVFADQMNEYVALAELAMLEPDPWAAFVGYLTRIFEMQATDRGLSELLVNSRFDGDVRLAGLRAAAKRGALDVITRAQQAGRLRTDFTPFDLALLVRANAGVVQRAGATAPPNEPGAAPPDEPGAAPPDRPGAAPPGGPGVRARGCPASEAWRRHLALLLDGLAETETMTTPAQAEISPPRPSSAAPRNKGRFPGTA